MERKDVETALLNHPLISQLCDDLHDTRKRLRSLELMILRLNEKVNKVELNILDKRFS